MCEFRENSMDGYDRMKELQFVRDNKGLVNKNPFLQISIEVFTGDVCSLLQKELHQKV